MRLPSLGNPESWKERFPGLRHWLGVEDLKREILFAADAPTGHEVAIASRSTLLMRTAARAMYRVCRNVLSLDVGWPAYQAEVADAAARTNHRYTVFACRNEIVREQVSSRHLASKIAAHYREHNCDGLFLPLVTNMGIKLPIKQIVSVVSQVMKPRFVIVDAAQAWGHLPYSDVHQDCDIFLAGAHKWIRAGNPLGIAIYGRDRSKTWLQQCLASHGSENRVDDPLCRFVTSLTSDTLNCQLSETVSVSPLLTCRAALADLARSKQLRRRHWTYQRWNRRQVEQIASRAGWTSLSPGEEHTTGILCIKSRHRSGKIGDGHRLRDRFASRGIAATCYDNGIVRMSMPKQPLDAYELQTVETGFALC